MYSPLKQSYYNLINKPQGFWAALKYHQCPASHLISTFLTFLCSSSYSTSLVTRISQTSDLGPFLYPNWFFYAHDLVWTTDQSSARRHLKCCPHLPASFRAIILMNVQVYTNSNHGHFSSCQVLLALPSIA